MKRITPEKSTDIKEIDYSRAITEDTIALRRIADAVEEIRDIQLFRLVHDLFEDGKIEDVRPLMQQFLSRDNRKTSQSIQPESPNYFEIDGNRRHFRTAKQLTIAVFTELAQRDRTLCARFSRQVKGHTRKYIARSKAELYPGDYERQRIDSARLPGGWWLGTHASNQAKMGWIRAACSLVGLELGRSIIVSMRGMGPGETQR